MFSPIKNSLALIKKNDEAIARWISHVISPHIVAVVITSVISIQFSDEPLQVLRWLMLLMPLMVVPPLIVLLVLVRLGLIEDIYIPDRKRRIRPLTALLLWLLFCLLLARYWAAPPIVEAFFVIGIALFGILSLVTLFWKISIHGAIISAAATASLMVGGNYTWPLLLLVPLVGWSRVRLARHTPRQVIYGSLVGALIALILTNGLLLKLV